MVLSGCDFGKMRHTRGILDIRFRTMLSGEGGLAPTRLPHECSGIAFLPRSSVVQFSAARVRAPVAATVKHDVRLVTQAGLV